MMKTQNKGGKYNTDTFTNSSIVVFRIITATFLVYNLFMGILLTGTSQNMKSISIAGTITVAQIVFICFMEPAYLRKDEKYGFAANIFMAVFLGFLSYLWKTPVMDGVFFCSIIIAGLGYQVSRAIMLSIIYYISYITSIALSPQSMSDMVFYNIHVLIIFIAICYLCHYFSKIESEKMRQDEAIVELLDDRAKLLKELDRKSSELDQTYWDIVETLIEVIEARDNFTGGHSVKVCEYSVKLAKRIGLGEDQISRIMKASILHDIGKMGIPESILLKQDILTSDEYNTIMSHPEIGCKLLSSIKGMGDVIPMILYHHERVDGKGYPYGIDGERIPIGAKIISIADAYDAMTSNRPYRKALLKKEARKRLIDGSGTQFDSHLVQVFLEIIDEDNVKDIRNFRHIENNKKNTDIV